MTYTASLDRNTWLDWFLGVAFSLFAIHYAGRLQAAAVPDWFEWMSPFVYGILGVRSLYMAGFQRSDRLIAQIDSDRWKLVLNRRTVHDGAPLSPSEVLEDGVAFNLSPKGSWRTIAIRKKSLPSELADILRLKGGEPGATDNPDDAQRLRKDH